MKKEIFPIKNIPKEFKFGGDYYATQSALLVASLADRDITIFNHNMGVETDQTISFLKSIGIGLLKSESQVRVETGYGLNIPEEETLQFEGTSYPISLIIGLLAGKNQSCTLQYSISVNPDIMDNITEALNENGIDIYHEADNRIIAIRAGTEYPVQIKVSSSVPHIKNCIMMYSLASGISCSIKEYVTTSDHLERCLEKFSIPLTIVEPKTIFKEDPVDPRKRIRIREADYMREIILPSSISIEENSCHIPGDTISALAMISLAVLKKKEVVIDKVALNRVSKRYFDFIKSMGSNVIISNREEFAGDTLATVSVNGKAVKARKMSGGQASVLADEVPFMGILAALGNGTSLIRGIADYNDCGIAPFLEIAKNLDKMGVKCGVLEDGLAIEGKKELTGTVFSAFSNFRIALAFYIAAMAGQGPSVFDGFEIIERNFPEFVSIFQSESLI